jgi:hypothetical protein
LLAAAQQDYDEMRGHLTALVEAARGLLAAGFTPLETAMDVWLTLRANDWSAVTLLGAAAVMQLATQPVHDRSGQPNGSNDQR